MTLLLAVAAGATGCSGNAGSGAGPPPVTKPSQTPDPVAGLTMISVDPFTNASSRHRTEVEPDVAAFGSTIVAAFQQGRFVSEGASAIGFATSLDGGLTWQRGSLPGITREEQQGNPFDTVSDPAVTHDAAHGVWLISSLPILLNGAPTPAALVSRSSDGVHWGAPIAVALGQKSTDKDWITCDEWQSSPFYGRCYVEWDDPSNGGIIHMSASADGGLTWGPARDTADAASGIGGQPVVRPDGSVVVPINDFNQKNMLAFESVDGGATWSRTTRVSDIIDHADAGGIRSSPLPSAAVDATGIVYLVWQDCRFAVGCTANDLVLSTSADGVRWTGVSRIPIDAPAGAVDHFIPGLAVDHATAGSGAHLALTYYYYPSPFCSFSTCQLSVGFSASRDGGTSWSAPAKIGGPMSLASLPRTLQGSMVGDYIATTFVGGLADAAFAIAKPPAGSLLDEAMYVPSRALPGSRGAYARRSVAERPVAGARSDHAPRPGPLKIR